MLQSLPSSQAHVHNFKVTKISLHSTTSSTPFTPVCALKPQTFAHNFSHILTAFRRCKVEEALLFQLTIKIEAFIKGAKKFHLLIDWGKGGEQEGFAAVLLRMLLGR